MPEDPDRELDRLIAAHLDDALSDGDAGLLHRRLRSDPQARAVLLAAAAQAAALPHAGGVAVTRRAIPRWAAWAAAAGLLLALGLGLLALADRDPAVAVRGPAAIERAGRAVPGPWLADGDVVRAGGGPVTLHWLGEPTRIELAAGGELRVERGRAAKRLRLAHGELQADVAPQDPGDGLAIATPHGDVEVVGTRFTVAVADGRSSVAVDHGEVRVVTPGAAAPVPVPAGYDARFDGRSTPSPSPRLHRAAAAGSATVVIGPQDWIAVGGDGWEGGLGDGCVTSVDIDEHVSRIMPPTRGSPGWIGFSDRLACTIDVAVDEPTTVALVLILDRGDGRGWLGNLQGEQLVPAGASTVAFRVADMRRGPGFASGTVATANVARLAVMSWKPRTAMRVSRIALSAGP